MTAPGARDGSDEDSRGIRRVVVVGGGTSGYFAALALKRQLPELEVTLLESSKIPIIGVGEATTTLMPPFLHKQLGIDIEELYRDVRPTWKLGIKFDWGVPGEPFMYPFGTAEPIEAFAHDGNIANQSVCAMMMARDRTPIVGCEDGGALSLLPQMKFAYHLENRALVAFLAREGRRAGLPHIDAEVTNVVVSKDGSRIEHLQLDDGRTLEADLFVDASGFRALLIEKALGSEFKSYASSLYCDTALVGNVPQHGLIEPYTTAQTMDAGWCWRIPVEGEDHRGYVYSSAYLSADQAHAEMLAKNPGLRDTWSVRFRSGRHAEFWKGNTVAVGNAYGFVEPLESTALHMVILELAYLVGALQAGAGERERKFANESMGAHWDFLRWFLAIHYKFNRQLDTPFWRDCRAELDVSGIQHLLDRFRARGPWHESEDLHYVTGDPGFSFGGIMILLLGQQVACPRPTATALSKADWDTRVREGKALVDRAYTQADALALLRRQPHLLHEMISSSDSWINRGGELIRDVSADTGIAHPQANENKTQELPYDHLFQDLPIPLS